MASKIGKTEWKVVIAVTGLADAAQWGIDFIPVYGEIVNAIADPVIGIVLVAYFSIRGVPMFYKPKRVLAMIAGGLAEELSLEILPAWILDVWYIRSDVLQEEAADATAQEEADLLDASKALRPVYEEVDGEPTRLPAAARAATEQKPVNSFDGIRPPNGGLNPAV